MFSEFNTALNCGYRPFTIAEHLISLNDVIQREWSKEKIKMQLARYKNLSTAGSRSKENKRHGCFETVLRIPKHFTAKLYFPVSYNEISIRYR
ncbi:hypothetical protein T4C_8398 [Trichinella pseudospiralis]|uniref:Uncharacterized protein n=1 Tax=Trichinella pseudospiralis TaxID=6337 RepID=A0A0V1IWD4_TRIPS|nr:hypothetical protein T4C_8398 [Trichinella pseudospiralis]